MSVDTLIENATIRTNAYSGYALDTANELRNFATDVDTNLYLPGTIDADGNYVTGLDLSHVALPTYAKPVKDDVAMPVYEPPLSSLPSAPNLADIPSITIPAARAEPTVNISGLFQQVSPSTNLPDFTEAEPDLNIDALINEMNAIAKPIIQNFDMPTLSALSLRDTPVIDIPGYDAVTAPDQLAEPVDYAAVMDAKYQQMLPEMQAFIDDKVAVWIAQYAPEYAEWSASLKNKVTAGLAGEALPGQFETAMFTRARGRSEQEFAKAEQDLLDGFSKRGFYEPPGALLSGLHTGRLKNAEALANQSTDIYLEKRRTEIQHLQFVMGMASSQIQSTRNVAISYAGTIGATMQQAIAYSSDIAEKIGKIFDHLIARSEFALKVMSALDEQYKTKLSAALSSLDGFKIELDVEKNKKEVELDQLRFIEARISAQTQEVNRYSALIDAVSKKSAMEDLKLKGYSIRADIFKNRTQAQMASFDAYKAAIEGDRAKMDGELSKIDMYKSLISTDQMSLDSQTKASNAIAAHNDAKIKAFESAGEVYKLDASAALQKFTAYAEVKKLSQIIYGQERNDAIEAYRADLEVPKIMMDAIIKQYELSVNTAIEEAVLKIKKLEISENAMRSAADNFGNIAQGSIGSLNTMVSSAISASA